jgi:hypothetical protein
MKYLPKSRCGPRPLRFRVLASGPAFALKLLLCKRTLEVRTNQRTTYPFYSRLGTFVSTRIRSGEEFSGVFSACVCERPAPDSGTGRHAGFLGVRGRRISCAAGALGVNGTLACRADSNPLRMGIVRGNRSGDSVAEGPGKKKWADGAGRSFLGGGVLVSAFVVGS